MTTRPSLAERADTERTFSIDLPAARRACKQAESALAEMRLTEAQQSALEAIAHRPSCFLAYQLLGRILDAKGHQQEASECYRGQLPQRLIETLATHSQPVAVASDGYQRLPAHAAERNLMPAALTLSGQVDGDGDDQRRADADRVIVSEGSFVDQVANGVVWHDAHNTQVLNAGGAEIVEHSVGCTQVLQALVLPCEPTWLGRRAIVLGARGAHNYYHWTLDIIPRLAVLEAAGIRLQADDIFVVPFARQSFAVQLLARFGIAESQIFETETDTPYITADQLLVPWLQNKMGLTMSAWLPRYLRQSVKNQLTTINEPTREGRKLFISRSAATADGRTLGNQGQLEAILEKYGFEIVLPERYSVDQQAELFSTASVVVAVHGAGLANLVYCAPGTTVIEFYGEHLSPCYQAISALAGHRYYNCHCARFDASQLNAADAVRTIADRRSADFQVSLEQAKRLLQLADVID